MGAAGRSSRTRSCRVGVLVSLAMWTAGCGSSGDNLDARTTAAPSASPPVSTPTSSAPTRTSIPTPQAKPRPERRSIQALIRRISRQTDGRIQLAVASDLSEHSFALASGRSTRTPVRMWSVAKVPTAIALLEAYGWGERRGRDPVEIRRAMTSALVGSADCAQRQLVVALQEETGGREAARTAVRAVLERGGARATRVLARASVAGAGCRPRLAASGLSDPYRSALQLGTAEWTIPDAARFALALGNGTYPPAVQRRILGLLRRTKTKSDDAFTGGLDVTTDARWGAGLAFAGLDPAYKAGWGGSSGETPTFVNQQAIFVRNRQGEALGIAVSFEPSYRPVRDDPALTAAPQAFLALLREVRTELDL
jgi:hypothetical protein